MTQDAAVFTTPKQLDTVVLARKKPLPFGKELRSEFLFDENYINLNHGMPTLLLKYKIFVPYISDAYSIEYF